MNNRLYNNLPGHLPPDWSKFDALELHGIHIDENGESHPSVDNVNCWTVCAHLKTGGVEAITDCPTRAQGIVTGEDLAKLSGLKLTIYA